VSVTRKKPETSGCGIKASNFLYNLAPQDGSTIGSIQNTVLFEPLWSNKHARPARGRRLSASHEVDAPIFRWHAFRICPRLFYCA
jgi:hypothetical protein